MPSKSAAELKEELTKVLPARKPVAFMRLALRLLVLLDAEDGPRDERLQLGLRISETVASFMKITSPRDLKIVSAILAQTHGNGALLSGDYDLAIEKFEEAAITWKEAKDAHGRASALEQLGRIQHYTGRHDEAHATLRKTLELLAKLDDPAANDRVGALLVTLVDGD